MSINLIRNAWLPVVRDGSVVTIRPDQIADPNIMALAWSRADFNLACLEFLIGLVSMALPPTDEAQWKTRFDSPDPEMLSNAFVPYTDFFWLAGDNCPRFMQDYENLERTAKPSEIKSVDMLFIDSAGDSTVKNNADLMVKRNRFTSLSPADAAMALYTLQTFAPSGGAGNRTSMRGGGPMTTLIQPVTDDDNEFILWRLIYANVVPNSPLEPHDAIKALPWLTKTRLSQNQEFVTPDNRHPLEAFFGMPRRLRLVFGKDDQVVGVVQKPHGTNYAHWEHPLTPYYRPDEESTEWLPFHPKPGRFSYRNWLGVTMRPPVQGQGTIRAARVVREYSARVDPPPFELLVGGWAMDNMKPRDFSLHAYPAFFDVDEESWERISQLVEAANEAVSALRNALRKGANMKGETMKVIEEYFFAETEEKFENSVHQIIANQPTKVENIWCNTLIKSSINLFDTFVLEDLAALNIEAIKKRINARNILISKLRKQTSKALQLSNSIKQENQK